MSDHKSNASYWFIAPAVFLMIVILIAPVVVAAVLSFTDYSLGNGEFEWVGWENYSKMVSRSTYKKMINSTLTYVLVVVPVSILLGLGIALLINSVKRFGDLYKTIYFLPVMAALLAMAIVWEFTLHPTIGLVNKTLAGGCGTWVESFLSWQWLPWVSSEYISWYRNGCLDSFPLWFGNRDYALFTLCFIGVWQTVGFNMVLYLAGLTSVPRELYQAAEMDGASSPWDKFWLVTLPMLGPTTVFVVTITTIRSFQVFDSVEAITKGGPAKSTFVMMYAIYEKAVQQNLIGMGAAITVAFLFFIFVLTLTQRYLVEKRTHYS